MELSTPFGVFVLISQPYSKQEIEGVRWQAVRGYFQPSILSLILVLVLAV